MATMHERSIVVFGGTGFLGAGWFGISVRLGFLFGLRRGIRIGGIGCLVLMIRNFARSRPTFTMSSQSPMHLLALTAL